MPVRVADFASLQVFGGWHENVPTLKLIVKTLNFD